MTIHSSQAWLYLASTQLLARRLARSIPQMNNRCLSATATTLPIHGQALRYPDNSLPEIEEEGEEFLTVRGTTRAGLVITLVISQLVISLAFAENGVVPCSSEQRCSYPEMASRFWVSP